MRGWIMANTLDAEGNLVSMERFMPTYRFSNPMDMEFASNGDLYMLEYGSGWFTQNDDARLIRIEYNGGNRKPAVKMNVAKFAGALPFKASISTKGTKDADGDALTYSWTVTSKTGFKKTFQSEDLDITLDKPGVYKATVIVDDHKGGITTESVELIAGNEPPQLTFNLNGGNKSFYFNGKTYNYSVEVTDKEDGKLEKSNPNANQVAVNIDFLPEGYDKVEIAQGHKSAEEVTDNLKGMKLIQLSDCKSCHAVNKKSVGPAFYDVSVRYKNKPNSDQKIAKKIISGGSGNWGEVPMAAHPQLSAVDAAEMAKYILSLAQPKVKANTLPSKGAYTVKLPANDKGLGVYVFKAAYKDRGYKNLPSIGSEETFTLRNPKINPSDFDLFNDVNKMSFNNMKFVIPTKPGAYIGIQKIDLTGIPRINVTAMAPKAQLNAAGGYIQVHIDQPNGPIIGQSKFIGDGGGFAGKPVSIDLKATSGVHDLYLVFKNDELKVPQSLMIVTDFEVKGDTLEASNPTASIPSKPVSLNDYVGKYIFKGLPFESITVTIDNGKVIFDIGSQKGEAKPTVEADKFDADGKATLQFVRDASSNVVKLKMTAMGQSFEGDKK
jgi:cytochrome c